MALDFPANPSDGQTYGSYIYDATTGVWKSVEESASPAVVSSTAPTTSNPGDIWVDSSDGIAYVRYDDGTSSQWIEMISSGVPSLTLKADKTYVDSQDLLKANLSGATFTGKIYATQMGLGGVSTTTQTLDATGRMKVRSDGSNSAGIWITDSSGTESAFVGATGTISSDQVGIYHSGAWRMTVDSSGRVLTPSQPTFFAWQQEGVGTYSTTAITNPIFTSTLVNTGNHYSTSNGRFTAPVAGTYEFNCMLLVRSSSAAAEMTFRKNGSNVVGRNLAYSNPSGAGGHDPSHYSMYITLAANDYVTPWISVNGSSGTDIYYGGGLGWFSGRLVG